MGLKDTKVIKEGKVGKKEIITTTSYKTGKPVTTTKENIIIPAEDKVITVGNSGGNSATTPYLFEYIYDAALQPGEIKIISNGKMGSVWSSIIYDVNPKTGELFNPQNKGGKEDAKNEIIHFGAGAKIPGVTIKTGDDTTKQSEEVAIPAKMFYEADPTLPYGTKKVVKEAVDGKKVYIGEFKVSADGTPTFKILEEKVIKPKQDGLTKVGNKKVETNEIPPLPGGSKPGIKTTTTIYDIDPNTGEESNPKVTTKISYPAEKIQDIAKTIEKEQPKEDGNGKAKEQPKEEINKQLVRQAMAPVAHPNVQTGVSGIGSVLTTTLLASVSLAVTKKKKED